ncbi:MAG: pyridoxal phosphate-dependent aminotransferase [Flavobacteriales bacterium]
MKESQTLAMARRSRAMKEAGHDVISLSLGEPDFNTPEFIKEGVKAAVDADFSHYTAVPGLLEAREAIALKFKRDNQLDFTPDQIMMSTGAKQSLAQIMLAILNKDDEVILPAPYWVSYLQMVELAEGKAVEISTEAANHYKITPEQLKSSITDKTKAFLFSSPCNPSGSLYSKEELEALANVLKDYPNILIISDEIYELINFSGKHESIAQFESVKDQTVIVNGLSKGYAMTGYRLGYIAGPKHIVDACIKVQGQITSATCAITQKAAQVALEADPSAVKYMRDSFLERRNYMHRELSKLEDLILPMPEGAFYLFPDVSNYFGKSYKGKTIKTSSDFAEMLLESEFVATVDGSAFGSPKCLRLSYAAGMETLKEAVIRIQRFVSEIK